MLRKSAQAGCKRLAAEHAAAHRHRLSPPHPGPKRDPDIKGRWSETMKLQLTAHVGKKCNPSFGLHNTQPHAEPQTARAWSSPDAAEHPQCLPAPGWPSSARWRATSLALSYLEEA
ncbi:hypothetical protein PBY51_011006 [Eleginops maclovinus]|uniref:Uncharacterized protein n=1 Tax=Eleginops maclovinus TaxID=56733 RepID=A0AAN8ACM1_ELEMC|nr:hypothetical protein PBY51_011006 [Eleginops maclovinus]